MDDTQPQTTAVETTPSRPQEPTAPPPTGPQKPLGSGEEGTKGPQQTPGGAEGQIEAFKKYVESLKKIKDESLFEPIFEYLEKNQASSKPLTKEAVLKVVLKGNDKDEEREAALGDICRIWGAVDKLCRVWGKSDAFEPPKAAEEQFGAFEANVMVRNEAFDRTKTVLQPLFALVDPQKGLPKTLTEADILKRVGKDTGANDKKERYLAAISELCRVWGKSKLYEPPGQAREQILGFEASLKARDEDFDRKKSDLKPLFEKLEKTKASPQELTKDDVLKLLTNGKDRDDAAETYHRGTAELCQVWGAVDKLCQVWGSDKPYEPPSRAEEQLAAFEANVRLLNKDFDRQRSILKPLFERLDKVKTKITKDQALKLVARGGGKDEKKETYLSAIEEICRVWGDDKAHYDPPSHADEQITAFEANLKARNKAFDRQTSILKPVFDYLDKNRVPIKKDPLLPLVKDTKDENKEMYLGALGEIRRVWGSEKIYRPPSHAEEHITGFKANLKTLNPDFDKKKSILKPVLDLLDEDKESPKSLKREDVSKLFAKNGTDKKELYFAAIDELCRVWGTDEAYQAQSQGDGQLRTFEEHVKLLNKDFDRQKSILKPVFDFLEKQTPPKAVKEADILKKVGTSKDEKRETYLAALLELCRVWGSEEAYQRPSPAAEQLISFEANAKALNKQFNRSKSVLSPLFDFLEKDKKAPKKLDSDGVAKILDKAKQQAKSNDKKAGNDKREVYASAIDEITRVWGTAEPFKQAGMAAAGVPPIVFARRNGAKITELMNWAPADMGMDPKLYLNIPDDKRPHDSVWQKGRAAMVNPEQRPRVLKQCRAYYKDAKPADLAASAKAGESAAALLKPGSEWNAGAFKAHYEQLKKYQGGTFAQFALATAHLLTTKQADALRVEIVAFKPKGQPDYVHAYVLVGREGDEATTKVPSFRGQEELVIIDSWAAAMGWDIAYKGAGSYPIGLVDGLDLIAVFQPEPEKK
jgi:hypothetical protein